MGPAVPCTRATTAGLWKDSLGAQKLKHLEVLEQRAFAWARGAPGSSTKREPMPVYTIFPDAGSKYNYAAKPQDGDFKQVYPAGFEFDPHSNDPAAARNMIRQPDRTYVRKLFVSQGLPVTPDHLPSKVKIDGPKRSLTDFLMSHSVFLVSSRFRSVVEELEPNRHQFIPVDLIWRDGSPAGVFFWFYPCARVDCMDREATTHTFIERIGLWKYVSDGKYVVNLDQVGNHQVWIDQRLTAFDYPFVSAAFRAAADKAGLKGVGYNELPAV